tara:strand:+ start:2628 stop:2786 length:159 start_codon:yes stop_codon:yes gene_type:complete
MGRGMTTVEWALRNGYIDDEQYRQYMLQETDYPLPKFRKIPLKYKDEKWEEI